MLNSPKNHQYTNISSNIEYQISNNKRINDSYQYLNFSSTEQKISQLFQLILAENPTLILNYLITSELSILRGTNKSIKLLIEKYYPIRLKIQYEDIKNFENSNSDKKVQFLKIYEKQIPKTINNWFISDINKAIDIILRLDRKTVAQLRKIKKLIGLNERIYAPFCIIFEYNSKNEEIVKNGWKKVADSIISDSKFFIKIANLKFENFEDEYILEAFRYLNENENNIEKIKRYSFSLYELNNWCKAVVSYHILVHPYIYRNIQNNIGEGTELYNFINFMNDYINKFYIFKGYLELKKLIKTNIGQYIFFFDFKDNNFDEIENEKNKRMINEINSEKIVANILSYLSLKERCFFMTIGKFGVKCFKTSLNILIENIVKKIFLIKYNSFNELYSLIPLIFENNIFSDYFFLLEDIVNLNINNKGKYNLVSFFTKENINDIRNYKGNNELINSICKIFCCLFNIRVEKSFDKDYFLINLYIKTVILTTVKSTFPKLIRYFNIHNLNNKQIKIFYQELSSIYSIEKIKKIKNINKGFYQLLLWEIYLFEYIKQFNPFLFLEENVFLDNDLLNDEQKKIIHNYLILLDQLKNVLKIKHRFDQLFFHENKFISDDLISIISNLINNLKNHPNYENMNSIIDISNDKQKNISKAYFQCKTIIEKKNLPSLYKKIMEELILVNIENVYNEKDKNEDNIKNNELKILKDENYFIYVFLGIKEMKYSPKKEINLFTFKQNYNSKKVSPKNIYNNKLRNKNKVVGLNKKKSYLNDARHKKRENSSYRKYNNYLINNNDLKVFTPQKKLTFSDKDFNNLMNGRKYNNLYFTNKSYTINNFRYLNENNNNNDIDMNNIFHIFNLSDIPEDIFITKILFYCSIYDFPYISLVNKYFYHCIKTHIYIRLFFLEKKKNNIENKYKDIISTINYKRDTFFKENHISPPNLQHSCLLLSQFKKEDAYELKSIFKKYKAEYEIIISVLCIFLNIRPNIYRDQFGEKKIDFFSPGKKLVFNSDFIKLIENMDLDSLNYETFTKIEKIMQNEAFSVNKINLYYSPSLVHLINLEIGVMEYFRAIRKYCLNFYDYYILDENEIHFCKLMDEKLKIYYRIKNYAFNKCQQYHQKSINLLKIIDLEQKYEGEINDFSDGIFNHKNNKKNNVKYLKIDDIEKEDEKVILNGMNYNNENNYTEENNEKI